MKKVLFVCLGNICRSPMAEAMLRDLACDTLVVDSAATSRYQIGNEPHHGTKEVLNSLGINTEGMFARQISEKDFHEFDYIIGMDAQNILDLKSIAPSGSKAQIRLCMDSVPGLEGIDVPDPYYTGDFEETKNLLSQATKQWYKRIKEDSA